MAAFLHGLQTGDWNGMERFLTPEVFYDASVPGWRYQYESAERVFRTRPRLRCTVKGI